MNEQPSLIQTVCRIAREAGAAAMEFYPRGGGSVTLKGDASPLTDADRASHHYIVQRLPALLGEGVPVISEESTEHTLANAAGRFWLVDPLDGTKEFLKGTGEFTVNIALLEGGRPMLGVVHAPAIGLTYYAETNAGAFQQKGDEPAKRIQTQTSSPNPTRVVASKDHAGPMVTALLSRLVNPELKSMGSSLKFCLVAEGEADIYLRDVPTMEWDTAAAQCIVETAGGQVCTLDGAPLRYGKAGLKNPSIITVGSASLDWQRLLPAAGT